MATKNGLVTLVVSEAGYQDIQDVLWVQRNKCDRTTIPGAARYAVLDRLLDDIVMQHQAQKR